ncbi:MAG: response regulator transcription factor [Burkholderiales bacterium]
MRILIVDDSSFAQHFTKKVILDAFPHAELIFASSGEQGYEAYINSRPDYVITDLLMPGIGGKAMIERIRKADRMSKIIVLSSDIQRAVKEEIAKLGALYFINKPLTADNGKFLIALLGGK